MNRPVNVVTEARLLRSPSGIVFSGDGTRSYEFWSRYKRVFSKVFVIARVMNVDIEPGRDLVVEGKEVTVIDIGSYNGPLNYILNSRTIRRNIKNRVDFNCNFIFRVPGLLNFIVSRMIPRGASFGVEVVGDPSTIFSFKNLKDIPNYIFGFILHAYQIKIIKNSEFVSFVTSSYLQSKYLPKFYRGVVANYSSINLKESDFRCETINRSLSKDKPFLLVSVGSMDQSYKGFDTLINVISVLSSKGYCVKLDIIGSGKNLSKLQELTDKLSLNTIVNFIGHLDHSLVAMHLDKCDAFILCSRTEGLPRSMIEAMARGLPCFGSRVGGIPELLDQSQLFDVDNVDQIVETILNGLFLDDLQAISKINMSRAREYSSLRLEKKRDLFYQAIKGSD